MIGCKEREKESCFYGQPLRLPVSSVVNAGDCNGDK